MEKQAIIAVIVGVTAALGAMSAKSWRSGATDDPRLVGVPGELQSLVDSRYAGLPTSEHGFAPYGWIRVVEPPPRWNPDVEGITYPICPRPEWFPYDTFLGPPAPVAAVQIDPNGYMFVTPKGIRVHRDGWVVTDDGRAFRAEEKIDDMGFPEEPLPNVSTPADRRL